MVITTRDTIATCCLFSFSHRHLLLLLPSILPAFVPLIVAAWYSSSPHCQLLLFLLSLPSPAFPPSIAISCFYSFRRYYFLLLPPSLQPATSLILLLLFPSLSPASPPIATICSSFSCRALLLIYSFVVRYNYSLSVNY